MCSRVDDTTVALAADYGTGFLHLRHNVHLAYGSSIIFAAVLAGHIAKGAGRGEVAYGIAGRVLQDVVGYGDESVFLAVHRAVLAEESQTVHIGVNDECYVVSAFLHQRLDVGQILLERFWVMLEVARRFGEESGDGLHAELIQ